MKIHSYLTRSGQIRTVYIHRPFTELEIVNRACRRLARRRHLPVMGWGDLFCALRNARPEWLKREHVATDFFMQAQRARRNGDYGLARIILIDLAQWRKRSADARAQALSEVQ